MKTIEQVLEEFGEFVRRSALREYGREIMAAAGFAAEAHARVGQLRKYDGRPYIVHPVEVAQTVIDGGGTREMAMAALLHDTIEDTADDAASMLADIERKFGTAVARMVDELTDKSSAKDGNRAARKAIDRAALAKASAEAQTVKVADLISNTASISRHDPKFARVYLPEKRALLEVMTKADPGLREAAYDALARAEERAKGEAHASEATA